MILTTSVIRDSLSGYGNPVCKMGRLVRDGKYHRVIRGIFETDPNTPGEYLAQAIYTPSYLSFEFALSRYGIIPEAVFDFTSATFRKRRAKRYVTEFGVFTYRDVPDKVFPEAVRYVSGSYGGYWMADPEKALCDKLYTLPPMSSERRMQILLFDDLRVDEDVLKEMDLDKIAMLSERYQSTNVRLLLKVRERIR